MIFTLLNRCKLKPTVQGMFNIITSANFFISIRIVQPFQGSSVISSLSVSRSKEKTFSKREETADLIQGGHERGRRTCAPVDDRT